MIIREATTDDIRGMQVVRNSVVENTLSHADLVTDEDCKTFLTLKGKGWVCEREGSVVGFSIVDLQGNNIWALFVTPAFEKQGIGTLLHHTMLDWYCKHTTLTVWLGTAPHTKAEHFYRKQGWVVVGTHGKGEIKFEMTYNNWTNRRRAPHR